LIKSCLSSHGPKNYGSSVLKKRKFFLPKAGLFCDRLSCKSSFLDLWLTSALKSICSSFSSADKRHYISTEYCTFKILSFFVVNLPLREENMKVLSSECRVSIQSSSAAQNDLQLSGKKIKGWGDHSKPVYPKQNLKKPLKYFP